MMDTVNLPAEIVARFANKTIAIIGYEVDQVYVKPTGDVSVPIYWVSCLLVELSAFYTIEMALPSCLANFRPTTIIMVPT